MKWYMVLNDGSYSELDGCAIVAIPDDTPDNMVDEVVRDQDGYYCFSDTPEVEPNNGVTLDDLQLAHFITCPKCGERFNPRSGFERIMWAQHACDVKHLI